MTATETLRPARAPVDADAEALAASIVRARPDPWLLIDADGRLLAASEARTAWLGLGFADAGEDVGLRRLHERLAEQCVPALLAIAGGDGTRRVVVDSASGAGPPHDVEIRISPLAGARWLIVLRRLDASVPAAATAALRVLYVEDNRINALLFEEAMRLQGSVDLRVAEDGAQALELVDAWQPQVLVLDAHLPDMSGYDVLSRLRERPGLASVPAYMCSADALEQDLQRARDAGCAGYWTKPIDVARVRADLAMLALSAAAGGG